MCANVMRTHFRKETLTLKDNFRLPQSLIDKLGLNTKMLKAGAYRLESFGDHFLIQFSDSNA